MDKIDPSEHTMICPIYPELLSPNGFLVDDQACWALWRYFIMASMNVVRAAETIVLEGTDQDDDIQLVNRNFGLLKGIAIQYGVPPERMLKFWSNVSLTANRLEMQDLDEKFKFRKVPEIRTQ